ncbi:MAG: NAD(P)H-dependent oxidoreductase subunit E [Campylobacterota bacterium]
MSSVDARYKMVEKTMKKLGYKSEALIEALHTAQETFGYLDKPVLRFIASRLRISASKVYGVATFYHYFRMKPKGRHNAVVCMGTACYIKGADKILQDLERKFAITVGQTTDDGLFSLLSARCVGSCSMAPVVIYDNKPKGKLDSATALDQAKKILS